MFIDAVLEALVKTQAEDYRRLKDAEIVQVEDPVGACSDTADAIDREERR